MANQSFYLPNASAYYYFYAFLNQPTSTNWNSLTDVTDVGTYSSYSVIMPAESSYNFLIVQGGGAGQVIMENESAGCPCGGGGGFVSYGTLVNDSTNPITLSVTVGGAGQNNSSGGESSISWTYNNNTMTLSSFNANNANSTTFGGNSGNANYGRVYVTSSINIRSQSSSTFSSNLPNPRISNGAGSNGSATTTQGGPGYQWIDSQYYGAGGGGNAPDGEKGLNNNPGGMTGGGYCNLINNVDNCYNGSPGSGGGGGSFYAPSKVSTGGSGVVAFSNKNSSNNPPIEINTSE